MRESLLVGVLGLVQDRGHAASVSLADSFEKQRSRVASLDDRKERGKAWRPNVDVIGRLLKPADPGQEDLHVVHTVAFYDGATKRVFEDELRTRAQVTGIELTGDDPDNFDTIYQQLRRHLEMDSRVRQLFDRFRGSVFGHIETGTYSMKAALILLARNGHLPGPILRLLPADREKRTSAVKYRRLSEVRATDSPARVVSLVATTEHEQYAKELRVLEANLLAPRPLPMLLLGPRGAGKSTLADRIHRFRRSHPAFPVTGEFHAVNCGALAGQGSMLESALFGHERGAFTDARGARLGALTKANRGTLFLDEVATLTRSAQELLLTALETKVFLPLGSDALRESEFVLVCATNKRFRHLRRSLRRDFLDRIGRVRVTVPPLVERREDLASIVTELCRKISAEYHGERLELAWPDWIVEEIKSDHGVWRGNVRELDTVLRLFASSALVRGDSLTVGQLSRDLFSKLVRERTHVEPGPATQFLRRFEQLLGQMKPPESAEDVVNEYAVPWLKGRALHWASRRTANTTEAAKALNIASSTFFKWKASQKTSSSVKQRGRLKGPAPDDNVTPLREAHA